MEELSGNPQSSIPQATGNGASIKGTYRFFDHEKIYPDEMTLGHPEKVRARGEQEAIVLAIQDPTELD